MKKGHRRVMVWTSFEFDLIGMDICYSLAFYSDKVKLQPKEIKTANGLTLRPGDVVLRLGGNKTSAGFTSIWFDDKNDGADGKGLVYEGVHTGLGGDYLCFLQLKDGKKVRPSYENYKAIYFAYKEMNPHRPDWGWFHTNHAAAGRIVETTNVILRKEPYNG